MNGLLDWITNLVHILFLFRNYKKLASLPCGRPLCKGSSLKFQGEFRRKRQSPQPQPSPASQPNLIPKKSLIDIMNFMILVRPTKPSVSPPIGLSLRPDMLFQVFPSLFQSFPLFTARFCLQPNFCFFSAADSPAGIFLRVS